MRACAIFMLMYLMFDVLKQNFVAIFLAVARALPLVYAAFFFDGISCSIHTFASFQMEYFLVKILARDYKMFNCRTKRM